MPSATNGASTSFPTSKNQTDDRLLYPVSPTSLFPFYFVMTTIVPAVLVHSEEEFNARVSNEALRKLAPLWQMDVLDGSKFHETSWADAEAAAKIPTLPEIELHLMIENPLPVVDAWKKSIPTVKRAIIHAELDRELFPILSSIKELGIETGIALDPETPIEDFRKIIEEADVLLIMGVHPGKSGQSFLGEMILQKIRDARERFPNKVIAVDGGVNLENARAIADAGANQLCVASTIWNETHPEDAFTALQAVL